MQATTDFNCIQNQTDVSICFDSLHYYCQFKSPQTRMILIQLHAKLFISYTPYLHIVPSLSLSMPFQCNEQKRINSSCKWIYSKRTENCVWQIQLEIHSVHTVRVNRTSVQFSWRFNWNFIHSCFYRIHKVIK